MNRWDRFKRYWFPWNWIIVAIVGGYALLALYQGIWG